MTTIDAPFDERSALAADKSNHARDTKDSPAVVATVSKALAILEIVADREGASAREIAAALDIPLSTAYRLAQNLVNADYLVHLKDCRRYELGFKLHQLGLSLHRQMGVCRPFAPRFMRCTGRPTPPPTSRSTAGQRSWWPASPTPPPGRG